MKIKELSCEVLFNSENLVKGKNNPLQARQFLIRLEGLSADGIHLKGELKCALKVEHSRLTI